jgi:hypothetical protein
MFIFKFHQITGLCRSVAGASEAEKAGIPLDTRLAKATY